MLNGRLPAILRTFIPLAVALTLVAGLAYLAVQQIYRQTANDPQIQMAEDAAAALGRGEAVSVGAAVDIAASAAPYLIVFDAAGQPVQGAARLRGSLPTVPQGVLTAAAQQGENRVTWQPERGVRSAAVIVPVKGGPGGYVLAGRSLGESERRTDQFKQLVLAWWLVALVVTLAAVALVKLGQAQGRGA